MKIDNSMMKAWWVCPRYYWEKYERKIEKIKKGDALTFGKRVHQLLDNRLRRMEYDQKLAKGFTGHAVLLPETPLPAAKLEAEAQAMFAAYQAAYPVEAFDVIDVERYFEVPLPCPECGLATDHKMSCDSRPEQHIYIGKFDGIVREHETGKLCIFEHKTEKRGGKQNLPASWAVRSQVSLYIWAAEQVYGEPFDQILLDVLTRQSEAGQIGPTFPPRQHLQRTEEQKQAAVKNLIWVADQIEGMRAKYLEGDWPFDSEQCVPNNWSCDYAKLHIYGEDEFTLAQEYKPAEEYLTL
jgi:hypothetical protein